MMFVKVVVNRFVIVSGERADDSVAKFTSLVRARDYSTSLFTCPGKGLSFKHTTCK